MPATDPEFDEQLLDKTTSRAPHSSPRAGADLVVLEPIQTGDASR